MTTPHVLFDYVGHLPECPTWSEDESALYWTDIPNRRSIVTIRRAGRIACWRFRKRWAVLPCVSRADLLWPCVMLSGWPIKMDYCSVRFATIPLIRNWRVSTMAALMAMDVLCRNVLGAGDYNGALLMRIDHDLTAKVIQCDIQDTTARRSARITSGCIPPIRRMA